VNPLPVVPPTIVLQPELRRHVIIDNSNLFISAQNRGGRHDPSVRINPEVLGRIFGGVEGKTGTRLIAGSKPPAKGKIWQVWENAGYRVKVCSRDVDTGAEDLVDEFLHAQAMNAVMAHAQDRPGENTLVLCTGDGNENHGFSNFVDVARNTAKMGWRVEIWSWRHSISRKYQQLANEHHGRLSIHYLDEFEDQIISRSSVFQRGEKERVISHPVRPEVEEAKEGDGKDDDDDDDDDNLCIVCMENPRSHLILPCGHYILCGECVLNYQVGRDCPYCHSRITGFTKVYRT